MAEGPDRPLGRAPGARVDYVVDENGSPIDLPRNSSVTSSGNPEREIGSTGPSNWWRIGLLVLGVIVIALGLMQIFGGAPGTDVEPDSPSSERVTEQVAPAAQ
jgi:hypothetical protein